MLAGGMPPAEVADKLVGAIRAGALYLLTDHDWDERVRARHESILAGAVGPPAVPSAWSPTSARRTTSTGTCAPPSGQGIRVNGVAPGHIDTRMARALTAQIGPDDPDRVFEETAARIPLGRYGTADEAASLVVWLLADEASYLSGATHLIDGALNA